MLLCLPSFGHPQQPILLQQTPHSSLKALSRISNKPRCIFKSQVCSYLQDTTYLFFIHSDSLPLSMPRSPTVPPHSCFRRTGSPHSEEINIVITPKHKQCPLPECRLRLLTEDSRPLLKFKLKNQNCTCLFTSSSIFKNM